MTVQKSKEGVFALPNKKILLVPVVHRDTFMDSKTHDGLFMFTGCSHSFVLPMSSSTGRLLDPLTDLEREYLEDELKVDLNINHKDSFYLTHRITIKKTSEDLSQLVKEFDLTSPIDYLDYKILLKCPNVAPSWAEKDTTPEYEWVLRELNEEFTEKVGIAEQKRKAYNWFDKVKGSKNKMYDALRLLSVPVSNKAQSNELEALIFDIIETPKKLHKLNELIDDIDYEHKLFIDKAIRIGEIMRKGMNRYETVNGIIMGNTLQEAVNYVKDKTNSVIIGGIKEKIEVNKI